MSFFDAPWHIVILLFAALILFGSSRLPGAAKALGSSMNIFKKAVKGDEDDQSGAAQATQATFVQPTTVQPTTVPPTTVPPAQIVSQPAAPQANQAQIEELQRQLADLRRQSAVADARPAEPQPQPHPQSY